MMKELVIVLVLKTTHVIYLGKKPDSHRRRFLITYLKIAYRLLMNRMTIPQIGAMYKGDRSRKENLVNYGFRCLRH